MNIDEAIKYLYSLGNETLAMKLGLDSVRALARALGNPQKKFPAIHIAGTNGKGSTAAMTASILRSAGLRAGLYTSPHLVSITERIRVDQQEIAPDEFARLATEVRAASDQLVADGVLQAPPTFFEQVTMIGFLYFAEKKIDLAVLEVGLGGRLDATNICQPVVTAITPIGFDHQQYLGDTLAAIAGEKAGIVKSGVPVVIAPQHDEAMKAIIARCEELNAPMISTSDQFDAEAADDAENIGRYRFRYRTPRDEYAAQLSLRGRHQITNALAAIHIAEQLRIAGFDIPPPAIVEGLSKAEWPGRLEMIRVSPSQAPLLPPVLLDGAHNAAGARVLRDFLDEHFSSKSPGYASLPACLAPMTDRLRESSTLEAMRTQGIPITIVFGAMADKAISEISEILFPVARQIIATRIANPRAADPSAIADAANRDVVCLENMSEAMDEALRITPQHGLICVCGSLFLVGEVRQALLQPAIAG
ncbi:MAG: folylpolyglutamate synthase/dihydrofolate synthase family protein [Blastocatellales bacterium]